MEEPVSSASGDIAGILAREGVGLWGVAPSRLMEDQPAGHRPSDLVAGARSLLCLGLAVPRGIFGQPRHVVESNWRTQNLYYRKLDGLSVKLAARLEEEGERAVPVFGCFPFEVRAARSVVGYLDQVRMGEVTRIGIRGRNGLLFHPRHGSRLMLGGVVTTAALPTRTDPQPVETGCPPDCRRCVEACPVGAIRPAERVVDGQACLGYTARTPLLPAWRHLLWSRFRPEKAARLVAATSVDEHTLHVCSRCVSACPT
jgi:epoxyqueuosine reductase